jgi:hypothetical protein
VPLFDIETIQQILPYVRVGNAVTLSMDMKQRLTLGQHSVLFRSQQVLEKSKGFTRADSIVNSYPGSSQRLFLGTNMYTVIYCNSV